MEATKAEPKSGNGCPRARMDSLDPLLKAALCRVLVLRRQYLSKRGTKRRWADTEIRLLQSLEVLETVLEGDDA